MAFRMDKLTVKGQEAVQAAHALGEEAGHRQLVPLHLLAGLLAESDGIPRAILGKIGVNLGQLSSQVDGELKRLPSSSGSNVEIAPSREFMQVVDAAQKLADSMGDQFVSTEHLLLGLTKVDDAAKRLLHVNGIEESDLKKAMQSVRD